MKNRISTELAELKILSMFSKPMEGYTRHDNKMLAHRGTGALWVGAEGRNHYD